MFRTMNTRHKSIQLALCIAALLSSAQLRAESLSTVEVRCHTQNVSDGGYEVVVEKQPITGILTARLSENSFLGNKEIARLRVVREDINPLRTRQYVGKDLRVDIDLSGPAFRCGPLEAPTYRCLLSPFHARISGNLIDNPEWSKVYCTMENSSSEEPRLPPAGGGLTCMAYWNGAFFDSATGSCVGASTSGCSNPFEFKTLADCEEAFATRQ